MYVHYAPLSVNNLQEKLESLHACGFRQLFNSLYLKKKKKKQGAPEGESFEGFAPQLALTHFCMALAFFHLFFGPSFQAFLNQVFVLSLIFFPYCFFLLSIDSFNLLSFLHTAPTQRSELVMRAANNLLWNYCKSCAGNWHLSQFYCEEGEEWKEIKVKITRKEKWWRKK